MLEQLLGNIDAIAEKLGLPADQVKSIVESATSKLGDSGDHLSALTAAAQEHGLSMDSIQGIMGSMGGTEGMLGKLSGMLDSDGDGSPVNDLIGMAKGLFSK
ncbi:MAG: hypothetical protein ABI395_05640 [Sphingobium sp.]